MAIHRATVTLAANTGIPEDACQNIWHFTGTGDGADASADLLGTANAGLVGFYLQIDSYFSRSMAPGTDAHKIEWATVTPGGAGAGDDTVTGTEATDLMTLSPETTGTPVPTEVAACVSLVGPVAGVPVESGSTRPRSRRTGRIYLPFIGVSAAFYGAVDHNTRPAVAFVDAVLEALQDLQTDAQSVTRELVVYSRAAGTTYPVESAWMDNAFDTQRRRGPKATTRTTVTVP